jgi:hypothetical protein
MYDNYGGAKVEYIFDNTRKRGLNLFYGTRFKLWAEYWRLVKEEQHDLLTFGFDYRHYQKIHRDLIWANRIAGATSQGKDRLIYYLGGVDSWLNPQFDRTINIVKPEQYQFQTLATNPSRLFLWCCDCIRYYALQLGLTYEHLNIHLFVILQPMLILMFFVLFIIQSRKLSQCRHQQ